MIKSIKSSLHFLKLIPKYIRIPRWAIRIEKRLRFVISTLAMAGVMLFSTFFFFDAAFIFIPILILCSIVLTYFSIFEGIEKVEWLTLFIMPVFFTVAFYLFYFLFPVRWLTRIPFIALYTVSIYAILLTSNIFNVGVEKNLQLYRAAFSVNYFYHTLIAFLVFNILFSLRENFLVNAVVTGIAVFPLALQFFWSIKLDLRLERNIVIFAFLVALILAQTAAVFSFVPFTQAVFALLLTAGYYSLSGLCYAYLDQRLFRQTVREYFIVLIFVMIVGVLTVRW